VECVTIHKINTLLPAAKPAEPIHTPASAVAASTNASNSSPRTTRVVVRALYNYDATEDNELSFKVIPQTSISLRTS
jgi:hypothetical protein